jgi:predicted PurR-regulated permease PerM
LQSFLIAAGTAVVMGIFGAPFLLGASLFAGFFMLIPFVGTALALVPPVLATVSSDPAAAALIFIILLVYQLVVVNVLIPRLLSQALGLHPLIIMAALLIGVKIGGVWGALLGVPVAGVLATMALFFYRRSAQSKPAAEQ